MAYCDSIMLSSPYPGPKLMGRAEDRRARVLERGNRLEPCPGCGGEAEVEPPCTVLRDGLSQMGVCRRCPTCGPSWSVGNPIPDPIEEEIIMPQVSEPVAACECGCGEPAEPGKRFATTTCGKRWAGRKGKGVRRRGKPGLCQCGCGESPEPDRMYASEACRKRVWRARQASPTATLREPPAPATATASPGVTARQVLDYLLSLTQEQRAALADVVAAEEACARLGVAL